MKATTQIERDIAFCIDELELTDYQIVNGNLSYKIEGTDWQDFILADKRAYSEEEYAEFLSLLEAN